MSIWVNPRRSPRFPLPRRCRRARSAAPTMVFAQIGSEGLVSRGGRYSGAQSARQRRRAKVIWEMSVERRGLTLQKAVAPSSACVGDARCE